MRKLALLAIYILLVTLAGEGVYCQSSNNDDSVLTKIQAVQLLSSPNDSLYKKEGEGEEYKVWVEDGDTIILANIGNVQITSPKIFSSRADYLKYMKYKRYAASVYPYAKEAVRIFSEAQAVTEKLKRRKRKRYLKKLSKELEREFEEPLSKMSKTQGKILIKMIEKELDRPMYDLIKSTRGKTRAFYWNQFSKLYGYRLKSGYTPGQNPILDVVLMDYDISYSIAEK